MNSVNQPVQRSTLRRALLPPHFADSDTRVRARIVYGLTLAALATSVVGILAGRALSATSPAGCSR
jgi:hypothetical protein